MMSHYCQTTEDLERKKCVRRAFVLKPGGGDFFKERKTMRIFG